MLKILKNISIYTVNLDIFKIYKAQISLTLCYVVVLKEGAKGVIAAGMISAICFVLVSIVILIKSVKFKFNINMLKNSLVFSIPLIPSLISAWVLNLSDRIFIERL